MQQPQHSRNERTKDLSFCVYKSVCYSVAYGFFSSVTRSCVIRLSLVCSASPWETANILLSHGHRKPSSWPGKERATTRANPGQGAGIWAQSLEASLSERLKREVISDHEPDLEMKPGDFIAGWTRARKLYLCYMDVKIPALACMPQGKQSKRKTAAITQDASGSLQAPVQQCLFVLGQVNIGTLTMNTTRKT